MFVAAVLFSCFVLCKFKKKKKKIEGNFSTVETVDKDSFCNRIMTAVAMKCGSCKVHVLLAQTAQMWYQQKVLNVPMIVQ